MDAIDLSAHHGVHPRLGAVDVVPFVPLRRHRTGRPPRGTRSLAARDAFAALVRRRRSASPASSTVPSASLPEVRRGAFTTLAPDTGPPAPHPTAGATAVGARDGADRLQRVDRGGPDATGLGDDDVVAVAGAWPGSSADPGCGPSGWPSAVAPRSAATWSTRTGSRWPRSTTRWPRAPRPTGAPCARGELVGLLPGSALAAVPEARWADLGLRAEDTIEFRLGTRRG